MTRTLYALILVFIAGSAGAQTPGEYPDHTLTPGQICITDIKKICGTKWGKDERAVTTAMKVAAYEKYGIHIPKVNGKWVFPHLPNGRPMYEVDHDASRELGGCDSQDNLGPQPYTGPWNARMKDRVENKLHVEACAGRITLQQAQHTIISDWRQAFVRYYGEPK